MVVSSLFLQIIRLVFNIYISNRVSAEVLGVFQLIMIIYYFGITIASSGINISCLRVVSEEYALGNNYGVKQSSKTCIEIAILLSFFASFVFYINADTIVKTFLHSKVSTNIIKLICYALPLISVSSAITGYFVAVRRIYKSVIGDFIEQISKIIAIIILFKINSNSFTVENICFLLILGDLISEIISFIYDICIYFFDLKKYFSCTNACFNPTFIQRIFRILFPIAITSSIKSGMSSFKQFIIPSSIEKSGKNYTEALSEYGIITGMAMPIIFFPSSFLIAIAGLLIPEFSRYYVKKDFKKIKIYTDKLLIGSFLFSLVLTLFFFIFGNKLGEIIYHNKNVGIYIKLFSILIPFMYVDIIIDNILKGLDAQAEVMAINIIDLIISSTFIFFFVPLLGINGYIISIFISEVLNLALSLKKLLKLVK